MDNAKDPKLYSAVKRDAKKKFERFPSIYASAWITREYKKRGGQFNENTKKPGLRRWFRESWIQVEPYVKSGKKVNCGNGKNGKACRPLVRVSSATPITLPELLEIHSKKKLLSLARKKQKNMSGRVRWRKGTFKSAFGINNKPKTAYYIKKSTRKNKKYTLVTPDKSIHFGGRGYSDYTIHKDPKRKQRYIERHREREDWKDPETPGALSRWILWNKKTLRASLNDYNKRFKMNVKLRVKI